MKKHRLFFLRAVAILSLALALLLVGGFVVGRDRAFSPLENRNLQTLPALSAGEVTSGRFMSRFDAYVGDQFPLRDGWIALKSAADRLAGRRESNGVFLGKDGYLIQDFTSPAEADYRRTADALAAFLNRHGDMREYVMIAPTAVTVLADRLPALADAGDEGGFIDRLAADLAATPATFIDLRADFAEARDNTQLYYRTDHHWTTDGARLAFLALARVTGLTGEAANWNRRRLSTGFRGTLSAASGFRLGDTEDLVAYLPEGEGPQYVVTWVEENQRSASLYRPDCLDTRDQYTVFLGGNFAEVRVETTADNGRVLLVLKDSYANCLLPFLVPEYQKLVIVDPRYFTGDLEVLMGAEGVNEILVLYNAQTFAGDTALRGDLGES